MIALVQTHFHECSIKLFSVCLGLVILFGYSVVKLDLLDLLCCEMLL